MKVMLARKWEAHINCSGCTSYLKIDENDLRMNTEESVHIVCEVCDTKTPVGSVPEYVTRKLKKLLSVKREVDTGIKKDDH
jgi:RNase P subunit RPR2